MKMRPWLSRMTTHVARHRASDRTNTGVVTSVTTAACAWSADYISVSLFLMMSESAKNEV
jgi:hypothetical protein